MLNDKILICEKTLQAKRENKSTIEKELAKHGKQVTTKNDGQKKTIDELVVKLKATIKKAEAEKSRWTHKFNPDEDPKDSASSVTIQFGTVPNPLNRNMVFTLLLIFGLKPSQPMAMEGDLEEPDTMGAPK